MNHKNSKKDTPFYIGYAKTMDKKHSLWLKKRIYITFSLVLIVGLTILIFQNTFYKASFDFLNDKTYKGVLFKYPYPNLRVKKGKHYFRYLLVNPGKHGVGDIPFGKMVSLSGRLISRDQDKMIEINPDSIQILSSSTITSNLETVLGSIKISGEIVRSKCFYGVMNPGHLKTHKACAILCIRGGIPPVFYVNASKTKTAKHYLMLNSQGKTFNDDILELVAQQVSVTGETSSLDNLFIIKADAKDYH